MQRVLSVIGWIGVALVFAAFVARVGAIAIPLEYDRYITPAALAGLALVLVYAAGQWRDIKEYFSRRQARYGAVATIGVIVALGIAIAVNYVSARRNWRWDLTENQQNSLSEQSVKLVRGLSAPVKLLVFDRPTTFDGHRARLTPYTYESSQVSVDYIDPDQKPAQAQQYEVQSYGTVVVEYNKKRQTITSDSEQDVTNALIKVMSDKTPVVYFTQGHGEKDPTSTDERAGYNAVSTLLTRDNYKIERLALSQQKDVPEDAAVVVVAGATTDFLPEEAEALKRYLARGGKLMLMLDPEVGTAKPTPNLVALAHDWGIDFGKDVVVDVSGTSNDPSLAVALTYPAHQITENFANLTVYSLARSATPVMAGVNGRMAQPLVQTSNRSWAETDLAGVATGQAVQPDVDKGDVAGPVTIAAAVSAPVASEASGDAAKDENAPKPETRVIVFGDSDFASNGFGGAPGNLDLFANSVNWLAQQTNLISIRPKEAGDRRLTMTPLEQRAVLWGSLAGIPLVVFGAGVITWRRRR
jgi:ABC-type uncharacterized transport system involved in gliding motility auxiliary subunit